MFDAATRLVLTAGLVYSYRFPFSTSVILDEGRIAWIGDDGGLSGQLLDSDVVVDCEGALITPMFFDAMLASTEDADASVGAGLVSTDSGPQLHRRSADGQWAMEPDHRDLASAYAFVDPEDIGTDEVQALLTKRLFAIVQPQTQGTVLSKLASAGVPFAFGSFGTSMSPWQWLRNAVYGGRDGLSARAAFNAATRSGWRLAGTPDVGELQIGSQSRMCLWRCDHVEVQVPDERVRAWSTDVRAGTPPLPDLREEAALPTLISTVIDGTLRKVT